MGKEGKWREQQLEIEERKWVKKKSMCICIYIEKRRIDVWMRERHMSHVLAAFDWKRTHVDVNGDTYWACEEEKKKSSIRI